MLRAAESLACSNPVIAARTASAGVQPGGVLDPGKNDTSQMRHSCATSGATEVLSGRSDSASALPPSDRKTHGANVAL